MPPGQVSRRRSTLLLKEALSTRRRRSPRCGCRKFLTKIITDYIASLGEGKFYQSKETYLCRCVSECDPARVSLRRTPPSLSLRSPFALASSLFPTHYATFVKAPISLIALTLAGTKPARPQDRTLKPVSWTLPPPQPSPNAGFPRTFDQLPNPSPLAHTCQIYIIFDPSLQRTRETAKTCDPCIITRTSRTFGMQLSLKGSIYTHGLKPYGRRPGV